MTLPHATGDTTGSITSSTTNPNPKVRKSGAVGKAVLGSIVLEEGSIKTHDGVLREISESTENSEVGRAA